MKLKNLTAITYNLVVQDAFQGTTGYSGNISIAAFAGQMAIPQATIPGDRLPGVKAQLDPLLQAGSLVVMTEEPFDVLVFRSTVGIPGLSGLDELIPRYLDPLSMGGGASIEIENHTVTAPEAAAKQFSLLAIPSGTVAAMIHNGTPLKQTIDFTISGTTFDWSGLPYDGVITTGDTITFIYKV